VHKIKNLQCLLTNKFQIVNKWTIKTNLYVDTTYRILIFCVVLLSLVNACTVWGPENQEVLARVGTEYLYRDDLKSELNSFESESDSILKSRALIDSWARDKILIQQAQVNLPQSEIEKLEQLIAAYRIDLYANTYRKSIVNKSIDTLVTVDEIDSFLFKNKSVFKLKAPLYQVRYIHLPPDNVDQNEIQRSFQRFTRNDQFFLDSLSFQYHSYILMDSLWINKNNLTSRVQFLNQENFSKYIKKSQFFKIEDTLGVYLFFVKDFLKKGELAPREVLETSIKNIILNQRQLKFTKQFEKEIIQDAIQSKTFEIY
jgi:hypothetical protein